MTKTMPLRWRPLALMILAVALSASGCAAMDLIGLPIGAQPLKQRARIQSDGLTLRQDFRIGRQCHYEFDLRLLHQEGRMQELDGALDRRAFPVPLRLRVSQKRKEGFVEILRVEHAPQVSGDAPQMTILKLGSARLKRGRYRVELESAAAPTLMNVDIDFVVQQIPKASC